MPLSRFLLVGIMLLQARNVMGLQQHDSVLNRIISIHAVNLTIPEVLEKITLENNIYFSYDASLIQERESTTIHLEKMSLERVLHQIFSHGFFSFTGKNNHVIITLKKEQTDHLQGTENSPEIPRVLVINGSVADKTTGEPLAVVSVSLRDRPVGTITNADGKFLLKIPLENKDDTIVFNLLGYARHSVKAENIRQDEVIYLQPISIRIREVKVKAESAADILNNLRDNIHRNYAAENQLLNGFYRETVKQDQKYISLSEAVMEILKAPYNGGSLEDKVRLLKARHSPDVKSFSWVNFKLQGGPYTITMLDAVKNLETFIDPAYEILYRYNVQRVIWYKNHPVYVIRFRPAKNIDFPCFVGEMYVDRESYALVYARYSLDDYGLQFAGQILIRKKPQGYKVKPQLVEYQVAFAPHEGRWHLHTAKASVAFRVKSQHDRVNSIFHSVSDLLITNVEKTDLKRFPVKELFTVKDVFAEITPDYDEKFWGNYNIIKPDEDLENAVRRLIPEEKTVNPVLN